MAFLDLSARADRRRFHMHAAPEVDVLVRMEIGVGPASTPRPPIHLALVLDRSESMEGTKLEQMRNCAVHFMRWLTRRDFLTVVAYDTNVDLIVPHSSLAEKWSAENRIRSIAVGNCTNMSGGWLRGLSELRDHYQDGHIHRVLLLTDGRANLGVTDIDTLRELARVNRDRGLPTTTVGIGDDFDEGVLRAIAEAGGGRFRYASAPESLARAFQEEFGELSDVVGQNLELSISLARSVHLAHVWSEVAFELVDHKVRVHLGDVRAGDVRQFLFRLRMKARRAPTDGPLVAAELSARVDAVIGNLNTHTAAYSLVLLPLTEESPPDPPNMEVVREVWLARGAGARLQASQRLAAGDSVGAAMLLTQHASSAEALAGNPLEGLIREEILRLRSLAEQIRSQEMDPSLCKTLVQDATNQAAALDCYRKQAGVQRWLAELSASRPEEAEDVVAATASAAYTHGFDNVAIDRVKAVMRELMSNAFEHGCAQRPQGRVSVECTIAESYIRLVVCDDGPGFDYEATLREEEKRVLQSGQRGRGLLLVSRLGRRVRFDTTRGTCAEVVIEKNSLVVHTTLSERSGFGLERSLDEMRDVVVLRLCGSMDAHALHRLDHCVDELFRAGFFRLVFDLSQLTYTSSSGMGYFIRAAETAETNGGKLVFAGPPESLRQVFGVLGLTQVLRITASVHEAMTYY